MSDAEATRWISTVNTCLSAIWDPLVTELELRLTSSGGGVWDSLTTVDLVRFMLEAAGSDTTSVREATSALLATASALWQRQRVRSSSAQSHAAAAAEAGFPSAPLCRLLGLLAIALCRTVGVEDSASLQRRLAPWTSGCAELGLREPAMCAVLDARSKGLLLYLAMVERGDARLKLSVGRGGSLWEALPQWAASPVSDAGGASHSVKLFPRFHGEAGEGHGPRKEVFALFGTQMLHGPGDEGGAAPPGSKAVLPYAASSRQHWFDAARSRTTDGDKLCRFAGWLMGQAVSNRAHLEGAVALPPLLFRCLLAEGGRPAASIELLSDFDPPAAANLQSVAAMKPADFAAMCELEDLDPASTTRAQYVQAACERLLFGDDVGWQLDAVRAGFRDALPTEVLRRAELTPSQLASVVCGASDGGAESDFTINTTFRIALADDDFEGSEPLVESVWAVLSKWPPAQKRRFVKFVTGSDRLPPRGTEVITLQMAYAEIGRRRPGQKNSTLGMLPQAHTCDNLLELPNYWEALCEEHGMPLEARGTEAAALLAELEQLLQQRLMTAVHECDDYGLDEGGTLPVRQQLAPMPSVSVALGVGACAGIQSSCGLRTGSAARDTTNTAVSQGLPVSTGYAPLTGPPSDISDDAPDVVRALDEHDDEDELDTLLAGFDDSPRPAATRVDVAPAPAQLPAPVAAPPRPAPLPVAARSAAADHVPVAAPVAARRSPADYLDEFDIGDDDNVDDLIMQLGDDFSPATSPSPTPAVATPRDVAPLSRIVPPPRRDDSSASKLTAAEIDLDLEIEALDL